MTNKEGCIGIIENLRNNKRASKEFTPDGFGQEIVETLDEHGYYPVTELIRWEHVMKDNWEALEALGKLFNLLKW